MHFESRCFKEFKGFIGAYLDITMEEGVHYKVLHLGAVQILEENINLLADAYHEAWTFGLTTGEK